MWSAEYLERFSPMSFFLLDLLDVCPRILDSCENSSAAFWVSPPLAFRGLIPHRHFCERRQSYANKPWPVNLAQAWRKFNVHLTSPVASCSDSGLGDLVDELTYLRDPRVELKARILFETMLHRYRGIAGGRSHHPNETHDVSSSPNAIATQAYDG